MKTKKIIASLAIVSMLVSGLMVSANAMIDPTGNAGDNLKKQVRIQEDVSIMNTGEGDKLKVQERVTTTTNEGTGEMMQVTNMKQENKLEGNKNASGSGIINSEKGLSRAVQAKAKVGKNSEKAEMRMNRFTEKFERKSKQEKLNQYQALGANIDRVMKKYEDSDISDAKKEAYRNLFEYVRALNEEKIITLEEVETATGAEVE